MKYLQAAIDLGAPADCASNGMTYADLLRTWNRAAGAVPKLNDLERHIEKMQNAVPAMVSTPLSPVVQAKRKRFFGWF